MKILSVRKFGPIGRFSDSDLYLVLWHLSQTDLIGRRILADLTGLGEGSVRSIISILKEWGFVETYSKGIAMTDNGRMFLENIPMTLMDIKIPCNFVNEKFSGKCCVLVKHSSSKISDGWRQRDVCVMSGAQGAVTFIMDNGVVMMPPDYNVDENDEKFSSLLRSNGMEDDDVFIIGYSFDNISAANGAVAASLDII